MEDHHVDRPDVEARQRVKLTGTNRSFDLIALVAKARGDVGNQKTEIGNQKAGRSDWRFALLPSSDFRLPALHKNQFCFVQTMGITH